MTSPPAKSLPKRDSLFKPPLQSSRSYPSLLSLGSPIQSSTKPSVNPSTPLINACKTSPHGCLPPLSPKSTSSQSSKSRLCDYTRLGNACFSTGQFDRAISLYTAALELNTCDACLWSNRGTAYVRLSLYKMGVRDYNMAIELFPQCGEFYYQRGVAHSALKQYQLAIQDYTSCIKLLPKHANAYNNRGNAYRILKEYENAAQDLKQACTLEPTSQLYQKNLQRVEQAIQSADHQSNNGSTTMKSPQFMISTPVLSALPPSPKLPIIQLTVDTTLSQITSPTSVQSIYQSINSLPSSPLSPASPPTSVHFAPQFIQSLLQVATSQSESQCQTSKKRKRSLDASLSLNDSDALRDAICLYQLRSLSRHDDSDSCSKKMRVTGLDSHTSHLLYDDDDDSDEESDSSASEGSQSPDQRHALVV